MAEKPWTDPFHPAEHLREDFLIPLGLSAQQTADALHLPLADLGPFLAEEAPLTAALALRLERAFGCTADYWMSWQTRYELRRANEAAPPDLQAIRPVVSVAAE